MTLPKQTVAWDRFRTARPQGRNRDSRHSQDPAALKPVLTNRGWDSPQGVVPGRGAFLPLSLGPTSLTHLPFPAQSGYSRAGTGMAGQTGQPRPPRQHRLPVPKDASLSQPGVVLGRKAVYLFMTQPARNCFVSAEQDVIQSPNGNCRHLSQ